MNQSQGIFEPVGSSRPASNPNAGASSNPFQQAAKSPFTLVPDEGSSGALEPGKPARLPEKRPRSESPFQMAQEPSAESPAPASAPASPFGLAGDAQAPAGYPSGSGFADVPSPAPAPSPFSAWQQAAAAPEPAPTSFQPAQSAQLIPAGMGFMGDESGSRQIKQLELRAIFGVDREMSHDEILQRGRSLPGIRHLARVDSAHAGALESLRQVLGSLGFGSGGLRIYCGSSPVEFIREGQTILAVQTDGGFAPGVRETLMLIARELGR